MSHIRADKGQSVKNVAALLGPLGLADRYRHVLDVTIEDWVEVATALELDPDYALNRVEHLRTGMAGAVREAPTRHRRRSGRRHAKSRLR